MCQSLGWNFNSLLAKWRCRGKVSWVFLEQSSPESLLPGRRAHLHPALQLALFFSKNVDRSFSFFHVWPYCLDMFAIKGTFFGHIYKENKKFQR